MARLKQRMEGWLAGLALLTGAAPALAQPGDGWQVYGILTFGAMQVDDGAATEGFFAENGNLPSRVGLWYRMPMAGGTRLSFNLETGFALNSTGAISATNDDFSNDFDKRALRKFEVIYDNPVVGRLSLGQGSMASDGATGTDLSGTSIASGSAIADVGGGTEFLLSGGAASGISVGDVFDTFDGPRRFRLRYDSPSFSGFTLSAAYGEEVLQSGNDNSYADIALRYAAEVGNARIEAALSYEWVDSVEENLVASAAILHNPTGLNAAIATGRQQASDARYTYLKLGIRRELIPAGETAFSVEYFDGRDFAVAGARSEAAGLSLVQSIDRLNADVFVTYRTFELATSGAAYRDVDVAMIGARWRF